MREYLVFTLSATLASFGDVAGHERRGSWTWPGRSAILGLLAAARGIRRDGDFAGLDALSVSVAVFETGEVMRDYHTVQTVPSAAVKAPQSRPQALRDGAGRLNTTITLRDYRAGVLYGVAVTGPGLDALAEALERPVFQLYLGRKSCPLNAPLAPRLVQAASAAEALGHLRLPPWAAEAQARTLYADVAEGQGSRVETRHDAARDRLKWHFAPREVHVHAVAIRPAESEW
jgi:CRISPR system Cascade subunit CasD